MNTSESIKIVDAAGAQLVARGAAVEKFPLPVATFRAVLMRVQPEFQAEADKLLRWLKAWSWFPALERRINAKLQALPRFQVWEEVASNTVVTQGKNSVLDVYLRAQTQITSWFCGLISLVSFSAIAAADTAAQINGTNAWKEAGAANLPTYTGARKALAFSAASAGSIATSAASSFTFTGTGTVKGMFGVSTSTVDGTTGTLFNAVLFNAPGDRAVVSTDVLNVTVTYNA